MAPSPVVLGAHVAIREYLRALVRWAPVPLVEVFTDSREARALANALSPRRGGSSVRVDSIAGFLDRNGRQCFDVWHDISSDAVGPFQLRRMRGKLFGNEIGVPWPITVLLHTLGHGWQD